MFRDRHHAAQLLAEKLGSYHDGNAIAIGIPRGGAQLAFHLADFLNLPFDVQPCAELPHPSPSAHAVGAVSLDGVDLEEDVKDIPRDYIYHQVATLQRSAYSRYKFYRNCKKQTDLFGKIVILTDDMMQSGTKAVACIRSIRKQNPQKIILAVPVASVNAIKHAMTEADDVVYLYSVSRTNSLAAFYDYLPKVSDDEVKEFFRKAFYKHEQFLSTSD